MGVYASTANTHKDSNEGELAGISYGVTEMQGWRKTMEDTHIAAIVPVPATDGPPIHIFGVFDGHGGSEVSHFCKAHFVQELPRLSHFAQRDFGPLLREAFLHMDDMLVLPSYQQELSDHKHNAVAPRPQPAGDGSGPRRIDEDRTATIEDAAQMLRAMLTIKKAMHTQAVHAHAPGAAAEAGDDAGSAEESSASPRAPAAASAAPGAALAPADEGSSSAAPAQEPAAAAPAPLPPPPAITSLGEDVGILPARVQAGLMSAAGPVVNSGCTAIVAAVHGRMLHVANAGDSRGVLCRAGRTEELSRDHKPMQNVEHSRITRAGGWVTEAGRVNGNLNLSRSIGDLRYKANPELAPDDQIITAAPEIRSIELLPEDEFVVLACDGIWDCKTSEEVVAFVRQRLRRSPPPRLSEIVEELFDECISPNPAETAGIGADNMTCIIFDLRKLVQ